MTLGKVADTGGAVLIGYGILGTPSSDGQSTLSYAKQYGLAAAGGRIVNFLTNAPVAGGSLSAGNTYWAPARGAILGGGLVLVGRRVVSWLAPSISRIRLFRYRAHGR